MMFRVKLITDLPKYCRLNSCEGFAIHRIFTKDGESIKTVVEIRGTGVIVEEHNCPLAATILSSGAIVLSAVIFEKNIFWTLLCSQEALSQITKKLEEKGVNFKLIYKAKVEKVIMNSLSKREYHVLRIAYEYGFFDYPRRVNLEAVANIAGISKSTASEILRRALKKVVRDYLELYPWFENE